MLTHVTAINPIATTDTFKHGDLEVEGSRETSAFLFSREVYHCFQNADPTKTTVAYFWAIYHR